MTKTIRLHDYQDDMRLRLMEAWQAHRSVMMQMPTGTGKTHVLAAVVKEFLYCNTGKVWIIAHRRELVAQAEETIARYGIGKEDKRVRVMAIQWLSRHWEEMKERPGLVVIDEAHHAQAKTYRRLWEECPKAKFLGLTATPCRMNRRGFTDLFELLVTSWSIAEFIEKGRLSAFDYVSIRQDSREQMLIDCLEKRGADGDYQVKEMNDRLNRRQSIEKLYESIRRFANGRKGIVYAISIEHARRIAEYYNRRGMNAVAIDSRTPDAERKQFVEDFKEGRIKVLVNVDVFSEGFDCPDVEFVQMARPTLSMAKYLQQVGRGLRKSDGKKACVMLDNVGLYRVFGLPTVERDWEAMFCGELSGKGTRSAGKQNGMHLEQIQEEDVAQEEEMEMVVSHNRLFSVIEGQRKIGQATSTKDTELKFRQDEKTGLWEVIRGEEKMTETVFVEALDIRYGMAAGRLRNNKIGIVDAKGKTIWEREGLTDDKFAKNFFLSVRTKNGKEQYVDLYSLRIYERRPVIKRYGNIEMLRVGHVYYSRTKDTYINRQGMETGIFSIKEFYLAIFDSEAQETYGEKNYPCNNRCGYACLMDGDHERYYWICRWMADGSIVVRDNSGRYYHAERGKEKVYIGEGDISKREEECRIKIERLEERAKENARQREEEKEKRRLSLLTELDAVPFRAGRKWGLKVGGCVTVPPIYRNVRTPVGKYCAVEKNYRQWGIITLDGKMMIEPMFQKVTIDNNDTAILTNATGKKTYVKLK